MNINGPRSIFPPLFTPSIYFFLLLSVAATIIFLSLCLILCKQQGRRNWQLLCTRWEWSYLLLCEGLRQLVPEAISSAVATYLYLLESYGRQSTLASLLRETCRCTASHLPLGVTNEERDANLSCIKQFLALLPGTQRRYTYASPDNSQSLASLSDSCIQNRGVARYSFIFAF